MDAKQSEQPQAPVNEASHFITGRDSRVCELVTKLSFQYGEFGLPVPPPLSRGMPPAERYYAALEVRTKADYNTDKNRGEIRVFDSKDGTELPEFKRVGLAPDALREHLIAVHWIKEAYDLYRQRRDCL